MSQVDIASTAMLASLSISSWEGRKLDRTVTSEVISNHDASADAARVNKMLLPKEWFDPITTVKGAARMKFAKLTLPWRDNGDRVLTSAAALKVMDEMRQHELDFRRIVAEQIDQHYDVAKEKSKFRLNTMYNEADYPSKDKLRTLYNFTFDIFPMPTANDFRASISQDVLDQTKANIESRTQGLVVNAMKSVIEEVRDGLSHLFTKLDSPDAKFKATTVTNLTDLADRLPLLNLTNDPNFDVVRDSIKQALSRCAPDDLRGDAAYRKEKAKEVQAIMDQMKGLFGG